MSHEENEAGSLQALLDRLASGEERAADDLIAHAMERLRRLARKLLQQSPKVHRWEATDDVLQNALVRLYRALKAVKPGTERDFINLAATQIRRELADLARHHFGPEGDAAHYLSNPQVTDKGGNQKPVLELKGDSQPGPSTKLGQKESLARQTEQIHRRVENLPVEEREVFDLTFYLGLNQAGVAKRLGISVPTVKRRWRSARMLLFDATDRDNSLI